MLRDLPVELLELVAAHSPQSVASLRHVVRMPWTASMIRHTAIGSIQRKVASMARAKLKTCVRSDCNNPISSGVVWHRGRRAWRVTSPYCQIHVPCGRIVIVGHNDLVW